MSSIYRNLVVLEQAGAVTRCSGAGGGHARYELSEELVGHHHHLVCSSCGRIEDDPVPPEVDAGLAFLLDAVAARTGFTVTDHRLARGASASAAAEFGYENHCQKRYDGGEGTAAAGRATEGDGVMGRRVALLAACLTVLLAAGCSGSGAPGAALEEGRLLVVATTTQVADLAANVGGDRVRVTSLLRPGIDYDYEPSPADIDALAHADLVLQNGVGLEEWLPTPSRARVRRPGGPTPARGRGCAWSAASSDPHIWQDPLQRPGHGGHLRGLAAADPAGAAAYEAGLAAYIRWSLRALDAEVGRQVGSLANRKVVTNYDAFGYYLDCYGLELVGSVIPSFDSSAELSGRDIRDLVAKIRATRVKAVFSETSPPPRAAETIGGEAGVEVVVGEDALYGDALGPPGSDGDTYLKTIRTTRQRS